MSTFGKITCQTREEILNDHRYTASILQRFQETKEIIGNHPSIRDIARDILEKIGD